MAKNPVPVRFSEEERILLEKLAAANYDGNVSQMLRAAVRAAHPELKKVRRPARTNRKRKAA